MVRTRSRARKAQRASDQRRASVCAETAPLGVPSFGFSRLCLSYPGRVSWRSARRARPAPLTALGKTSMDWTSHLFSPEPLGWLASLILLSTIGRQIWRQAHAPTVEGVSKWLFIGQMAASVLYLVYSILVKNPVFIASNAALLIAGITGQVIYLRRRNRQRPDSPPQPTRP